MRGVSERTTPLPLRFSRKRRSKAFVAHKMIAGKANSKCFDGISTFYKARGIGERGAGGGLRVGRFSESGAVGAVCSGPCTRAAVFSGRKGFWLRALSGRFAPQNAPRRRAPFFDWALSGRFAPQNAPRRRAPFFDWALSGRFAPQNAPRRRNHSVGNETFGLLSLCNGAFMKDNSDSVANLSMLSNGRGGAMGRHPTNKEVSIWKCKAR